MAIQKVALLTAGGLAPCLSSAVGGFIERYSEVAPHIEILGYLHGYQGLLRGQSLPVTKEVRAQARVLHEHGGSPLGNSRIKLTNVKDCLKRGLIQEGQDPLQVAAQQLTRDGITILHTIGGDDTNTTAADLAAYLKKNNYALTVVGLPKTVDNDVVPIGQSLGAWTAAEQGALYFENVVNERSANPRTLIVHEVMGRHCGWLTAATARAYRQRLARRDVLPAFNLARHLLDIDAVFVPELSIDIPAEAARLRKVLEEKNAVTIFLAEGAGVDTIVAERESAGETIPQDAFGHPKLDAVNPGAWFGNQFGKLLGAEKTLVQKSGYFARSAPANSEDLRLIKRCVDLAVECALRGESGVIGQDEERGQVLRAIEFPRIRGGKPFDVALPWFTDMLREIGQPVGAKLSHGH